MQPDFEGRTTPDIGASATEPPEGTPRVHSEPEIEATAADRVSRAAAERAKASRLLTEGKYTEARKALEEADAIESKAESGSRRMFSSIRSRLGTHLSTRQEGAGAVESSVKTVNVYSGVAVVVGLLPGGLLNFAAILAVQVIMVWRIAKHFGQHADKGRIRGAIVALIGSAVPAAVGHTMGAAIAAIPAVIAGTLVYFIVTPVLAWAMTQAVGKTFIMHFESGGTLLTFDPKAFGEYFLSEFQKAGGTFRREPRTSEEPLQTAPARP
jgi:uncharacterized protein (DUF697 family)